MWTYVKLGALAAVVVAMSWLYASRADAISDAAKAKAQLSDFQNRTNQEAIKRMEEQNLDALIRQRNNERIADAQDKRDEAVRATIARTERSNNRLRDTIADLERRAVPEDSTARAYAHEAAVARAALEQCSNRYRWVDGEAKKLGSQVIGLQSFVVDVCKAGSVEQGAPLAPQGQNSATPDKAGL